MNAVSSDTPVAKRYERICFEKTKVRRENGADAVLITPGHPLLNAVIQAVREKTAHAMDEWSILVDDTDSSSMLRLLFAVEDTITSGASSSRQTVSKQMHFVEIDETGRGIEGGSAPYLDYRAPTEEESNRIRAYLQQVSWSAEDARQRAHSYAVSRIIPDHLARVRKQTIDRVEKTKQAVDERLTDEIRFLTTEALKRRKGGSKPNEAAYAQARKRIDELTARRDRRLNELEGEKQIRPSIPKILTGALIVPAGLLAQLEPDADPAQFSADAEARKAIEFTAMQAVMQVEKALGHLPRDVSADKIGYDIESMIPEELREEDGSILRFLEVKGRASSADEVTVTANEIRTAINSPDQYILAIADISPTTTTVTYLKKPFPIELPFGATCINFNIQKLKKNAEILLEQEIIIP